MDWRFNRMDNINKQSMKEIETILLQDPRFISADGNLLKNKVYEAAMQLDSVLLELLLAHKKTEDTFFQKVNDIYVFDKQKFGWTINSQIFLPDSYTSFSQKVILEDKNRRSIVNNDDVVIAFPYKDGFVEFDSTDEKEERDEVFYHEILGKQSIDTLTEPKLFSKAIRNKSQDKEKNIVFDDFDNLLIKGNNLIALHSLLPRYKNSIKLMYWDILFNTKSDNVPYKDSFKHSTWLAMMKNRLEVARNLLSDDGLIFIHCDKNEDSYLKVLMDEIFERNNYITTISVKSNSISGTKTAHKEKTILKNKDSILVYSKTSNFSINPQYTEKEKWDTHYNSFLINEDGKFSIRNLKDVLIENNIIDKKETIKKDYINNKKFMDFCIKNKDSVCRMVNSISSSLKALSLENPDQIVTEDGRMAINGSRITLLSSSVKEIKNKETTVQLLGDLWTDLDFQNTQNEGGKDTSLPAGKKPEMLVKRIIEMASEEGDIVLDAYSGSGTTAAVALKTGRRFIAIEQLNKHYDISKRRLESVLKGEQSGISKIMNWKEDENKSFVSTELKELGHEIINKITNAKTDEQLISIYNNLIDNPFVTYRVDFIKMNEESKDFESLAFLEKKDFLFSVIEKNNLYLNYNDSMDNTFKVDSFDILFSDSFYKEGE